MKYEIIRTDELIIGDVIRTNRPGERSQHVTIIDIGESTVGRYVFWNTNTNSKDVTVRFQAHSQLVKRVKNEL